MKDKLLVADALIFQNVIDQTGIIQGLIKEEHYVTMAELKTLSPYLTRHIRGFCVYVVDLCNVPPPLDIQSEAK